MGFDSEVAQLVYVSNQVFNQLFALLVFLPVLVYWSAGVILGL